MQLGLKSVAAIVVGVVVVSAGAYVLGTKQSGKSLDAKATQPGASDQTMSVAALPPGATLPPNHPPMDQALANQTPPAQTPASQGSQPTGRAGNEPLNPNAKFSHFKVGNSNVKSIFADGKITWVGMSAGVVRYDTSTDQYRLFDTHNGLLSNGMFYVGKLDGRIMVGTYGGGLSLYDETNDTWENFNLPNGLADAFVYGVLKASNGDIWIATWSGANRVRGGNLRDRSKWDTFTVANTKGGLPNDWVYGLAQGKDGEIWMATEGGLARFKDGKWQNWNHSKGLGAPYEKIKNDPQFGNDPAKLSSHHARQKKEMGLEGVSVAYNPNYIVSLQVDRNGVVWAGTWGGGLGRFDGKTWRNYTMSDGLPGNHVFTLHYDPSGQLWVGTNNGLTRFDNGKFTKALTTVDGLYDNVVFSMTTAPDGSQWVGSYGGVAHLAAPK